MRTARTTVPSLRLSDGIEIPRLGFGASQVPPEETQGAVELAFMAGYRHIDTAASSDNEEQIGAALAASGLSREEYFVTAKSRGSDQGHDATLAAFEASLERLGLDHVDLYLLDRPGLREGGLVEAWRAFERIHGEEAARTIGISNFSVGDLELLERETDTLPTINQAELHPYAQQAELRAWHAWHGVATEAWGPLDPDELLDDAIVGRLAESRGKTPAQVILRWHLQLGNVVIPKSVTPEQIRQNIEIFDFALSHREMAAIRDLNRERRIGPRPATSSSL